MRENTTEVLVGAAVLAIALGFLLYLEQSAGFSRTARSYELKASFRAVDGISVGTDVRLAGVKIGTVTAISLNPTTYRADTQFSVRQGIQVPDDSAIAVTSDGLLGNSYIEVVPGGSPDNLPPGGEIEATQSSVSLISLLMKFVSSGAQKSTPAPGAALK